jgi:hypothetical protein
MVQIGTSITKAQVFRFENFWVELPGFFELVQEVWHTDVRATNAATRITAKLKILRRVLKRWSKSMAHLTNLTK